MKKLIEEKNKRIIIDVDISILIKGIYDISFDVSIFYY